jgi:N6-adenosine-specific RNA methylase IME4
MPAQNMSARNASSPLTSAETRRLTELEAVVSEGLAQFISVAQALLEIRQGRLYRQTHPSFEAYVSERFGLARRTAYGYLEAAVVHGNVPPEAHLSLSHLRALAPLEAAEQHQLAPIISPLTVAEARRVIREWRAQTRTAQMAKEPPPFPIGTWRTIVADPPYRYEHDWGDGLAADHYATMTCEEISALPISGRAAPDSHLYLWAPVTKIPDGIAICEAWGFRFVSLLTWVKPGLGLGTYWRISTEHIIFGVRGRLATRPNHRNWFEARRGRHSAKPAEFYTLVENASPGPYLELFARQRREGWETWGNEVANPRLAEVRTTHVA